MAAPTYKGKGTASAGFTSPTAVALPTGGAAPATGDLILIIEESANATHPAAPTGYTTIAQFDSFADGGVGSTTTRTVLSVFGKIATASESDPTVNDGNNHASAQCFVVSNHGVTDIATDIVVGSGTAGTSGSGGISIPGITVTADSLILMCASTSLDGLTGDFNVFTNWSNSNLASVTERTDQVVATGNGGGYGFATGTCAGTTTGNSTATLPAVDYAALHIGIPPASTTVNLVIADGAHAVTSDNVALVQQHTLAIADAAHAVTSDSVALVQNSSLVIQDAAHAVTSDQVTLVQNHNLVIQDAANATTSDNVDLTQNHVLVVQDAAHAVTSDNVALVQQHVLAVDDAAHAVTSDNVVLSVSGATDLVIQDAAHAVTSDNATLTQAHILVVQDAAHAVTSDNLALTQVHNLVIQDASHGHTADNVTLSIPGAEPETRNVVRMRRIRRIRTAESDR